MPNEEGYHTWAVRIPNDLDAALRAMMDRDRRKFSDWVRLLIEREARRRKVYPAEQATD